jgi:hypothetical protein
MILAVLAVCIVSTECTSSARARPLATNLFPVFYAEPERDRLPEPYEGVKRSSGGKAFDRCTS